MSVKTYPKTTLLELYAEGNQLRAPRLCMATKRGGKWIETSLSEFQSRVDNFALGLYGLGVRKGDKVGLHSENSTEWMITDMAIISLGAVDVPIYATQPADQIKYILENAEAIGYVVSNEALYAGLKDEVDGMDGLKFTVGMHGSYADKMHTMADIESAGEKLGKEQPNLLAEMRAAVKPDDLATFIYTSGTTGVPKGVMLSHNNIASNVLATVEVLPFDFGPEVARTMLSYLPLSHIFERMLSYVYIYMGYPIWFVEDYTEVVGDFAHVNPDHFTTVPRLLEKIYIAIKTKTEGGEGLGGNIGRWALNLAENFDVANPPTGFAKMKHDLADKLVFGKFRAIFGANMEAITSGGAALTPKVMNFMNAIGFFCGQGYGMTESSPVITSSIKGNLKAGTVGKVLSGVQVRIADDGEIQVKGPNVMQGYFKMPDKTAETMTEDGWLCTGDIGKLDDEGFISITDRKKALFKLTTGKYVAPQNIEGLLTATRCIEQAMVIGNGQKFAAALVVPNKEALETILDKAVESMNTEECRALIQKELDEVNAGLPHWEQIKKYHVLHEMFTIETGELTAKMSMKRRVINQKYSIEIEAIFD